MLKSSRKHNETFLCMSFYENSSIHHSDELFLQTTPDSNYRIKSMGKEEVHLVSLRSVGALERDGYSRASFVLRSGLRMVHQNRAYVGIGLATARALLHLLQCAKGGTISKVQNQMLGRLGRIFQVHKS